MPVPQVLYSSPMRRSALTLQITWDKYITQRGSGRLIPQVREALRESIGLHTCDQRSEKSVIEKQFPKFEFEEPFSLHVSLRFLSLRGGFVSILRNRRGESGTSELTRNLRGTGRALGT